MATETFPGCLIARVLGSERAAPRPAADRCRHNVMPAAMAKRLLTFVVLVVAAAEVARTGYLVSASWRVGIDFAPLRHAAASLLHGRSVYTDPRFVYPPTAAPVFVPLTIGRSAIAYRCWVAGGLLTAAITACGIGLIARHRRVLAVGACTLLLVDCAGAQHGLRLGQFTPYLVAPAAAMVFAFYKGRWRTGCVLLSVTLLIKPLLLPLILVPLINRRWKDLFCALVPAAVVLGITVFTVPGGSNVKQYIGHVLGGTNLHGKNSYNNVSLYGWAETHHFAYPTATAASMVLIAIMAWLIWRTRHVATGLRALQLAIASFATVLLISDISELHYFQPLVAMVLVRLVVVPSRASKMIYAPFLLASCVPRWLAVRHFADGGNTLFVLVEIACAVAAFADVRATPSTGRIGPRAEGSRVLPERAISAPQDRCPRFGNDDAGA